VAVGSGEQRPKSLFTDELSHSSEAVARPHSTSKAQRLPRSPAAGTPPCWLLLILYSACVVCLSSHGVTGFDCDFIRVSNAANPTVKNGSFAAPLLNGHTIPPHGLQCIYTFIALPTERVKIGFRDFNLAGRPPECLHEYIDLYTELRNASEDLVQTDKFGGRFCGRIAPRPRISLFNTIVLVFSSDQKALAPHLFSGTFEFINASIYDMGTPAPPSSCAFVVSLLFLPMHCYLFRENLIAVKRRRGFRELCQVTMFC
jgi:CUB domain